VRSLQCQGHVKKLFLRLSFPGLVFFQRDFLKVDMDKTNNKNATKALSSFVQRPTRRYRTSPSRRGIVPSWV
jgi:hypothetical protein